jgi:hypothetical protein
MPKSYLINYLMDDKFTTISENEYGVTLADALINSALSGW